MTVWFLTMILVTGLLEIEDGTPYQSEGECRAEGIRQAQDYQAGNVKARYDCEPREVDCEMTEDAEA